MADGAVCWALDCVMDQYAEHYTGLWSSMLDIRLDNGAVCWTVEWMRELYSGH